MQMSQLENSVREMEQMLKENYLFNLFLVKHQKTDFDLHIKLYFMRYWLA